MGIFCRERVVLVLSPSEFVDSYAAIGARKTQTPALRLLLLGALAGLFIALGGAVTNTAAHTIANVSAARGEGWQACHLTGGITVTDLFEL